MEPWKAALRIAYFLDQIDPDVRAKVHRGMGTPTWQIRRSDLMRLIEKKQYRASFHDELVSELNEFGLGLVDFGEYFLVVGWQDPERVPVPDQSQAVERVLERTAAWDETDWEAEWDKDWE